MVDGNPINLNGSGNKAKIIAAQPFPSNEPNPPIITMAKKRYQLHYIGR